MLSGATGEGLSGGCSWGRSVRLFCTMRLVPWLFFVGPADLQECEPRSWVKHKSVQWVGMLDLVVFFPQ